MRLRDIEQRCFHAVVSAPLVRAIARLLLPVGPEELCAPRPATWAERGLIAFAAAAVLESGGFAGVFVESCELDRLQLGRELGTGMHAVWPLSVHLAGADYSAIAVVAAARLGTRSPRRELRRLLARRGVRLAATAVSRPVFVGHAMLPLSLLCCLRDRDVIALGRFDGRGVLGAGAGGVPVRVESGTGRVIVTNPYERGATMSEVAADDITVEISCRLGSVRLSARQVLELEPGQVLEMSRPVGGLVDILCGQKVIGRGELVDVDGEIGVRIVTIEPG